MSDIDWVRVTFRGKTLWVERNVLAGKADGPLAPEHHVVDGKLSFPACFDGDSYAHVFPDERGIMRYLCTIGTVADLVPVNRAAAASSVDPMTEERT